MELSNEQQRAVRWQWWLVVGMIVLVVLTFLVTGLLGGWSAFPGPVGFPQENLFFLIVCCFGGLANLAIGALSVRYEVTILGRRIKFWEPVEGGMAVFHGWMGIIGGVILLVVGLALWSIK